MKIPFVDNLVAEPTIFSMGKNKKYHFLLSFDLAIFWGGGGGGGGGGAIVH